MEEAIFDPEAAAKAYVDSMGADALDMAAAYTMGSHWLVLGGLVVSAIVTFLIMRWGGLARLEDKLGNRFVVIICVVTLIYMLLASLLTLPWTLYAEWWRETQYGRTSQPILDFLGQEILKTLLQAIGMVVFFVIVYLFIRRVGRLWWLWAGGLTAVFMAAGLAVGPTFIEPLFNNYEQVPEGEVRDALLSLTAKAGIPEGHLLMYDGSRQSNNFTAYVSGIGDSARIAISDVAFKDAPLDEVLVITGHEIGHYTLGHAWRLPAIMVVLATLIFFFLHRTFPFFAGIFRASREIGKPSNLPVFIFAISVFAVLAQPLMYTAVRQAETEADMYSAKTVNMPDAMARALINTGIYRDPRPATWQELLFYSHPSVERRIRAAMEHKASEQKTKEP